MEKIKRIGIALISLLVFSLAVVLPLAASEIVVDQKDPNAGDKNPGTAEKPLKTISRAAEMMKAGDRCIIHEGVYRERVTLTADGTAAKPLIFTAAPGESVVLTGTETIKGTWKKYKGGILVCKVDFGFEQMFANGEMMVEARWPNARADQMLDRDTWAYAEEGARHGWMKDKDLATSGLDATGAIAWLGVAHQFFSWSRPVLSHKKGDSVFTYSADLQGLASWGERPEWPIETGYQAPRYILIGKLELLDQPGEWYLDSQSMQLYFWPPKGTGIEELALEGKVRDLAFDVKADHVQLSGIIFFATTFSFTDCDYGLVENSHLIYPSYSRIFSDNSDREVSSTSMSGNHHTIRNSSLAYSSMAGFSISGADAAIEQTLVHDVCWNGSLHYTAISVGSGGEGSSGRALVKNNTVYNGGNALIGVGSSPDNLVAFNHIYQGGRACKDVSLLYTQLPDVRGTVFSYNWVHDCNAPHIALGIRGDDQTRGLIVHHNVVWNIAWEAILVKGDDNQVYSNTCFNNDWDHGDYADIMLYGASEPVKPWRKQWPLLKEQNKNSLAYNNVGTIRGDRSMNGVPFLGRASNNMTAKGMDPDVLFRDAAGFDFRPAKGSPLIDAGTVIDGVELEYKGSSPDIGAYEFGGEPWIPGCDASVIESASKAEAEVKKLLSSVH